MLSKVIALQTYRRTHTHRQMPPNTLPHQFAGIIRAKRPQTQHKFYIDSRYMHTSLQHFISYAPLQW